MATSHPEHQHLFPDWSSKTMASYFDDLENEDLENDVEVSKAAAMNEKNFGNKIFDPVVGGRHTNRSSSSRSSAGSTGFYDTLELSPTTSLSPFAFDQVETDDNAVTHLISNFNQMGMSGDFGGFYNQPRVASPAVNQPHQQTQPQNCSSQMMANLAALAQLSAPNPILGLDFPLVSKPSAFTPPNAQDLSNNYMEKPGTMQIRCKFGSLGDQDRQFHSPHGFCMGPNEDIIVADTYNHRIQVFDKEGIFKFAFGLPGKEEGMLWFPRKVAVIEESGNFVICDRGNERSRMQIFSPMGIFIRRIPIRFIDIVAGLAVNREGHIVAVDSVTPTIFVLHESGKLIKFIECSEYMTEPSDISIFNHEYYICDFKGHSIVVMHENGSFLRRIGCQPVTNFPNGIDISDAGDILVGDSHGNMFHVAVYDRFGKLIAQFQCPQVKVSRCCGLKITSEGYIVTLAKNNHHVLVLNTLYVP